MVYHPEYAGYYTMSWHDKEENALKRWFENYKIDRYASFACDTECLIVQEREASARRIKKRQVCLIEDEGRKTSRFVIMDHTAPSAPMLTFAAKRKWQPPPPKSVADLKREAEYRFMMERGYEPRIRRVPVYQQFSAMSSTNILPDLTMEYREEIEWVRHDRYRDMLDAQLFVLSQSTPPPPTHRRNV